MDRALFLVDLQQGPLREDAALRDLADRAAAWARQHREAYAIVAASGFRNEPGSTYDRIVGHDLRTDVEVALHPPVREVADIATESSTYSSLTPDVEHAFRQAGVREVDVIGIDTDQCVLATVFALFDAGYEPRVLDDLVGSASGQTCHEAGLIALRRAIGEDRVHPSSDLRFHERTDGDH